MALALNTFGYLPIVYQDFDRKAYMESIRAAQQGDPEAFLLILTTERDMLHTLPSHVL